MLFSAAGNFLAFGFFMFVNFLFYLSIDESSLIGDTCY